MQTPEIQELKNKTSGWKSAEEEEKTKEVAKKSELKLRKKVIKVDTMKCKVKRKMKLRMC
ncbi:hypothetical protein DPMN_029011 [Dreissena polymorpha]|uniref:Uncharacterized protein n=1 Tax=Dreissena polymorpha TaxID=45954 RepID=A0A9D4RFV3_DREPO|nr:hypothetical protein DPMN_029011 [Dreissena polymorpha]